MKELKHFIYKSLFNYKLGKLVLNANFKSRFPSAAKYWENRYRKNGTSGPGSYGELALYKASIINQFVIDNDVLKVIELGCGDGHQLQHFDISAYVGFDVSPKEIEKCIGLFKDDLSKSFFLYDHKSLATISILSRRS